MLRNLVLTASMLLACAYTPAMAQAEWPEREVNVIVPYSAGGTTDAITRIAGEKLRERLGVPFLINNLPGAGGNIGTEAAARAEPDGYTFVVGTISTHAVNQVVGQTPFDPEEDFVTIGGLFDTPNILFVRAGLGITTVQELVDYLKENPGTLFFGSTGPGSSQYIAAELLQARTETTVKHVTYKGAGDIMTALLGGHLDLAFNTATASTAFLDNASVTALGVTSAERLAIAPDLPILSETVDDFVTGAWSGVWAPASTPEPIVRKMTETLKEVVESEDFVAACERLGTIPLKLSGADFETFVDGERARWAGILKP